jgi:hypothetical protein
MSRNITLVEVQTELHELAYALRTFGYDRANDGLVTQASAGFERIAYVQLK